MGRAGRFVWAILWSLVAGAMARDWSRDPFVAGLEGTKAYGHNHATALRDGLVITLIELAVLYVLVPSWTAHASVWRSGAALVLFGMLVPVAAVLSMHSGGVVMLHLLWLLAVTLVLFVLTVARIVVRLRGT